VDGCRRTSCTRGRHEVLTMTIAVPPTTAIGLFQIEELPSPAAKRRRERWAKALKALGVVLLLVAIAW
jgi:hypothetical protein